MECTQRLECTQDLYESRSERVCPEQSVSRQHAVINVLSQTEIMLMDLDSANKTKLMNKVIPAYMPQQLKNGDLVQFGDIFGVFRLLEEDNELPMTQAIDMPDTPVSTRHMSKLNLAPVTTIPESPDVSDRDESFIAPSQPKSGKCFKASSSNHFIKPTDKIISIQPVGSTKLDNVFWNISSKKSVSLNSQFDDSSLDDSTLSNNETNNKEKNDANIHKMDTQPPPADANDTVDSIYTANTQVSISLSTIHTTDTQMPGSSFILTVDTQIPTKSPTDQSIPTNIHIADTQGPSTSPNNIYGADTQIPGASPSIHSINTQMPSTNLPEVCKIEDNQQEMRIDLYALNNKNNKQIFEADTQCIVPQNESNSVQSPIKKKIVDQITQKLNVSNEVILFDDLDCQEFEEDFASQPLLPPEPKDNDSIKTDKNETSDQSSDAVKKGVIIHSDSSTDCEDFDMQPTQKITPKDDEDLTDCEDIFCEEPKKDSKSLRNDDNFEDMLTQVIVPENIDKISIKTVNDINRVEDLPTQIIVSDDEVIIAEKENSPRDNSFEDMPTQVICEPTLNISAHKDRMNKSEPVQDVISPFKIPLISPKLKKKHNRIITHASAPTTEKMSPISTSDDDNYYAATQDILNDLSTPQKYVPDTIRDAIKNNRVTSPKSSPISDKIPPISISLDDNYYAATQDILNDLSTPQKHLTDKKEKKSNNDDDDVLPSSVENYEVGSRFPYLDNLSPRKNQAVADKSSESSDGETKVNNFVSNLSSQQIRDMVGVENQVDSLRRARSDPSDIELTPKKVRPNFMDIDLPSSQEIKNSVSANNKINTEESSSESEMENDSEECTPILFRKKKKSKVDAKMNLTEAFNADALPTRVLTRVRKPTSKIQNSEACKILNPMYLPEQEDEIDKDIITENITRLKSKNEKSKHKGLKEVNKKQDHVHAKDNTSEESDNKNSATNNIADKVKRSRKSPSNTVNEKADKKKAKETEAINKKTELNSKSNLSNVSSDTDESKKPSAQIVSENQDTTVAISAPSRSTRSTRNRRKAEVITDTSSISKDDNKSERRTRSSRRQNDKRAVEIDLTDDNVDVRRSKRPRKAKNKADDDVEIVEQTESKPSDKKEKAKKPPVKRGRPPVKHEQSTVYNLSSESGADSPCNAKRSASGDMRPPSPKRTKPADTSNNNISLRSISKPNKSHYVLCTAFNSEDVRAKLEKLGAPIVTDVSACTVVLTSQLKRTFKLLCAVGLGRPIVGCDWIVACLANNTIVDPWQYILVDKEAEKRFKFNLERTLLGKRNYLKDYTVFATPSVMPSPPEMKLIVECSGGTWSENASVVVSCAADKELWPALRRRGAAVVSSEFILSGVLRQRADVAANKLTKD